MKQIKLMLITNTNNLCQRMEAEAAVFGEIKYLNLVKVLVCAQQFHFMHSHVEAGMRSHLRVQTDTGQQGMEVFDGFQHL